MTTPTRCTGRRRPATCDVVRRLADAGGDVIGDGDDHALEVIGWATCWDGCDDAGHRAVVDLLVSRGARHHIFSAIALNLADEVRRIVSADQAALNRRMSRNENHQLPIHFAVRMKQPAMVALLMDWGRTRWPWMVGIFSGGLCDLAARRPPSDEAIAVMTAAELTSAVRGDRAATGRRNRPDRRPGSGRPGDRGAARARGARVFRPTPRARASAPDGQAKRRAAVQWLLDRGADPNARWSHWDSEVTPLHLAVLGGHPEIVRLLVGARGRPASPRQQTRQRRDRLGGFFERQDLVQQPRGPAGDA